MPEKHLLLPSAKTAVLVPRTRTHYARYAFLAIGLLSVLVGAADLATRAVEGLTPGAAFTAFAPAAALGEPQFMQRSTPGVVAPTRMRIPSLGVDAAIEPVGVKDDGSMGTPKEYANVAWYSLGVKPGEAGSAVFAGHVNNGLTKGGVFKNLAQIKKGEYITLSDETGRTKVYQVSSVELYPKDASTEGIFARSGQEQIALITCDGEWVPSEKTFDTRLVVIAKPAY